MRRTLSISLTAVAAMALMGLPANPNPSAAATAAGKASLAACSGAWSLQQVPNPGSGSFLLDSLSAAGQGDMWAVGEQSDGSSLAMRWDGTAWSSAPVPTISGGRNELFSVAAASPSSAWAEGYYSGGSQPGRMYIANWDGSQWTLVPSLPGESTGLLYGISAATSDDVWAVGSFLDPDSHLMRTLVLHWDGNSWSQLSSPNPALGGMSKSTRPLTSTMRRQPEWIGDSTLMAVSAVGRDDAWAVGETLSSSGQRALIEHWDGAKWTIVPSPDAALPTHLRGVAGTSDGQAWAMGYYETSNGNYPYAVYWDGTTWNPVATPAIRLTRDYADLPVGISATETGGVWAGAIGDGIPTQAVLMQWVGRGWKAVASPPNTPGIESVSALPDGEVWALGSGPGGPSTLRFTPGDPRCMSNR